QAARNNDTIAEIDAADMDAIGAEAATAFRKIVRKGFEESVLEDEDRIQGYRIGADALVDIENLLVSFIKTSTTFDAVPPDLAERFATDRATFAARFQSLYGEAQ
ncbi:MAG: hypothetical protein VYE18_04840, partial [Pseudomonadota bacterium]|nr:hypothetical protein [Pseudomonadota bacterium]